MAHKHCLLNNLRKAVTVLHNPSVLSMCCSGREATDISSVLLRSLYDATGSRHSGFEVSLYRDSTFPTELLPHTTARLHQSIHFKDNRVLKIQVNPGQIMIRIDLYGSGLMSG